MKLIFNEYNGHDFLAQIWKEEDNIGRVTTRPPRSKCRQAIPPKEQIALRIFARREPVK